MNFLDKMERKYGRYALKNLPMFIIATYVAGYVLELLTPEMLGYLTLEPYYILHGQVWRLVTWILIPPSSLDIFTIIMLFFYFSIGQTLERTWGSFKFDVYIFSGLIFTVIGAFLLYGMTGYIGIGMLFTTYYINMSIFLAFALTYPDMQVMLYFIIPIKMKWMGALYGVMILVSLVQGNLASRVAIIASLFNFIVFFLISGRFSRFTPHQIHRRQEFKRNVKRCSQRTDRSINVRSAAGRSWTGTTWSFASARSVTAIMNIVRIICSHMSTEGASDKVGMKR